MIQSEPIPNMHTHTRTNIRQPEEENNTNKKQTFIPFQALKGILEEYANFSPEAFDMCPTLIT